MKNDKKIQIKTLNPDQSKKWGEDLEIDLTSDNSDKLVIVQNLQSYENYLPTKQIRNNEVVLIEKPKVKAIKPTIDLKAVALWADQSGSTPSERERIMEIAIRLAGPSKKYDA